MLEDVKVLLDFAREEKLMNASPGEGEREVYVAAKAEKKFTQKSDYKGVAGNLLHCNLDKWAVKNQSIPRYSAKAYGDRHLMPAALSQVGSKMLKYPIGVAVVGATSPGPIGAWRRISLDLQTFGFVVLFADLLRKKPYDNETKKLIQEFKNALLHCPMDFYYFDPAADLEEAIFKKSFEIMEQFRKAEEVHAPGGWQVCCLFNAAKELQLKQSVAPQPAAASAASAPSPQAKKSTAASQADEANSVCKFFDGFQFADTSEYKKLDKKLSKDCLLVHDRMVAAQVVRLLTGSWAVLGQKNSLDGLHKLIQISQRVSAAAPVDTAETMRFVVKYTFYRMRAGTMDTHVGIRVLRPWLTVPLTVWKLIKYVTNEFVYTKAIEKRHIQKFHDPETWYAQASEPPGDHRKKSVLTL